jgi:hypothetical protein
MKTPNVKLLVLFFCIGINCIAQNKFPFEKVWETRNELRDAAYQGDLDFLKEKYDGTGTNPVSPAELVGEALAGHQYEVVKWCAAKNPDAKAFAGWFGSKQMDLKAAQIILSQLPALKTNYCNRTLSGAVFADNLGLLKFLLDAGLKSTSNQQAPPPLLVAAQLRRLEAIRLLIEHGENPYEKVKRGSPIDLAIMLESADLLRTLDRDKKYSADLIRIENDLHPSKKLLLAGTWADLHEGFGSVSITLYPDGTGVFGSDIGGMPCVVKNSGGTNRLILLEMNQTGAPRLDERNAFDIKLENNELVMMMNGKNRRLAKFNLDEPRENSIVRRPYHVRIEKIYLTPTDDLYIQINGRLLKVPISQLVAGAQATRYGFEVVETNLLRWNQFQKGTIPESVLANATHIPFVDKHADPGYSIGWDKLGFDHEHLASTKEGFDFTLFPSSTTKYYHGPNTGPNGEHVDCYVLLSKKTFNHGRNWLMFFLLKSKSNDVPRQSPW